jgi:hypothetical protein
MHLVASVCRKHHAALQSVELQQLRRAARVAVGARVAAERLKRRQALPQLLQGPLCFLQAAGLEPRLSGLGEA